MKDARLELRIDPRLKKRVEEAADERGQKITTFVERALESALGAESRKGDVGQSKRPMTPSASSRAPTTITEAAKRVYADNEDDTPGCPECAAHMTHDGARWVCPDCGFVK